MHKVSPEGLRATCTVSCPHRRKMQTAETIRTTPSSLQAYGVGRLAMHPAAEKPASRTPSFVLCSSSGTQPMLGYTGLILRQLGCNNLCLLATNPRNA